MNTIQVWMLFGIPALAMASGMFLRRSVWRSLLGYAALAGGMVGMAAYDRTSAVVLGVVAALMYATGRGGSIETMPLGENEEGVEDAALHPSRRRGESAS